MREFRFILGRRALIVFLALLVATGALLGMPAATRTLAGSPPPSSLEVSEASADSAAAEEPILDPSGHSSNLPAGSGDELLQFTSDGHVLGFSEDGIIVALASHMLKTEFLDANAVGPEADGAVWGEEGTGMALPLGRVTYRNLWEGVTLVYEASEASIVKSSYYLDDGMAAQVIRLRYNRPVNLDGQGNLAFAFDSGTMVEAAPVAWQEINGQRKTVSVVYRLYGESEVGFSLGDYVPGIPVIIDPTLTWNTFLGGSDYDYGYAIAVDGSGNVYVGGTSDATWGSPVQPYTSGTDAFAAKLTPTGALVWNTFLGGSGTDYGYEIAVDGSRNVYVGGTSYATWGLPVQGFAGVPDAFAAKLTPTGALVWNTFLGGSGTDNGYGIAVDSDCNVYVGGTSNATWGVSPVQPYTSGYDAFAAKLTPTGALTWNTFLGGSGDDYGRGIAVDGDCNVYVGGYSTSTWSGTSSPVRAYTSGIDAFAAKLTSSGTLTWNTFLGGSGDDQSYTIAVDGSGNVYVGGYSNATWSGTSSPVRAYTSGYDAFAAKLTSSGTLTWNTFLGGSGTDYGYEIAVDGSGNVYVGGYSTYTWGSPVQGFAGGYDAFAAKLTSSGALTWNTFLGGSGIDLGYGIAVDGSGNVYVGGYSSATWGSPVRAFTQSGSNPDAFAVKLNDKISITSPPAGATWTVGQTASITWTSTDLSGTCTVELSRDGGSSWTETLTTNTATQGTYLWTVSGTTSANCFIRVTNGTTTGASGKFSITAVPTIAVTSPTAGAHWAIGTQRDITWTSSGLDSSKTLTILLARDGVHFTYTITTGLTYTVTHHTWTVTGPGAINAKVRVQQDATMGVSSGFFTIADAYSYSGTSTLTTSDPWLEISGGTGTGTLWVTPLTPTNTSDPDLNQFFQETGKRSALFFDIGQEGLTGTLTIVLHYNPQLGEETFVLYRWDSTNRKWVNVPGIPPSPNIADHTFTFTINADDLKSTPFGLGGDPAAMPGMSPWALGLLSLALLGAGGWWFTRRRRLA